MTKVAQQQASSAAVSVILRLDGLKCVQQSSTVGWGLVAAAAIEVLEVVDNSSLISSKQLSMFSDNDWW